MQRVDHLFSIASIVALGFGLIAKYVMPERGFTITSPQHTYFFSPRTPCYGIAALFALFAFLYSIGYIPFSRTMMQWHFWLSMSAVALFATGFAGLCILTRDTKLAPSKLELPGTFVALSLLTSISIFLFAQVWFAVGLTRSFLRMHHP